MPMSQYHLRWGGLASLVGLFSLAIAPTSAQANVPLTQAEVQAFRNRVEILLKGGLTRPLRSQDRVGFGDAIRTQLSSQADLAFNDGSLARVGELTTFWFLPNTREFRLAQGTALLQIHPGSGSSVIETPNTVTTAQSTAVVVRYVRPDTSAAAAVQPGTETAFPNPGGRTAVMVVADSDGGAVEVHLRDSRSVNLSVGQMAIVDNDNLYIFEFDLALFYETSPLVQGLLAASETAMGSDVENPPPFNALPPQPEFAGDYWLDPQFLSPSGEATVEGGWLFPTGGAPTTTTETETDSGAETLPAAGTNAPERRHDSSDKAGELTPNPTDAAASEEELMTPSSPQNLDVPAGVISPPAENVAPVEQPAEPSSPLPALDPTSGEGDRPADN